MSDMVRAQTGTSITALLALNSSMPYLGSHYLYTMYMHPQRGFTSNRQHHLPPRLFLYYSLTLMTAVESALSASCHLTLFCRVSNQFFCTSKKGAKKSAPKLTRGPTHRTCLFIFSAGNPTLLDRPCLVSLPAYLLMPGEIGFSSLWLPCL
ncbi:hypothetical protein V8C35DRAFT_589 [Trichoderma chlorosporum]